MNTLADEIESLRKRLSAEYPDLADHVLESAMAIGCARTADDRVKTYRFLFIERHARSTLDRLVTEKRASQLSV